MPKKEDIISTNTAHISSWEMVIISEKYLRIEISRLIMIAHTHVCILPNHRLIQLLASQKTLVL